MAQPFPSKFLNILQIQNIFFSFKAGDNLFLGTPFNLPFINFYKKANFKSERKKSHREKTLTINKGQTHGGLKRDHKLSSTSVHHSDTHVYTTIYFQYLQPTCVCKSTLWSFLYAVIKRVKPVLINYIGYLCDIITKPFTGLSITVTDDRSYHGY